MSEAYYHTEESVNEYVQLAADHNGKRLIDQLKPLLPAGAKVLELGTGPGTDWEILAEDYEVVGSDLSKVFLARLAKLYPEADFLELDAITLPTEQKFDAIYANKVLHHLNDAELTASLQRQAEQLNPGGLVCHSFWAGEGEEEFKGMYVNYHTREALEQFFSPHFEVLVLEAYPEFEAEDSFLVIARKKGALIDLDQPQPKRIAFFP